MEVETYECEEVATEPLEITEEAKRLIDELGLTGQQELVCPNTGVTQPTRQPYRVMHADEEYAARVLCPAEFKVDQYKQSPIPIRVLQAYHYAKSLGFFDSFAIWDKQEAVVKDPFLIGKKRKTGKYEWGDHHYLIARWGEELESFPVLIRQAADKMRQRAVQAAQAVERSIAMHVANIQSMPDEEVIGRGADWKVEINI